MNSVPSLVAQPHPVEDLLAQVDGQVLPTLLPAQLVDAGAAAVLGLGETAVGRALTLVLHVDPAGAELDAGSASCLLCEIQILHLEMDTLTNR